MFLLAIALAASPAAATPPAKVDDDPVVCKTQPRTNSRMGKRVCMRQSAIDARTERDKAAAGELVNQPVLNPPERGTS